MSDNAAQQSSNAAFTTNHSSTPVAHYFAQYHGPGVSPEGAYVVLPRMLLEQLPLAVQHQVIQAVQQAHHYMAAADWPEHRVVPSRWEPITGLDDQQLREAGLVAELDPAGTLVYRELASGRQLSPEQTADNVLVPTTESRPRPHPSPHHPATGSR